MDLDKFKKILVNDITRNEDKSKEFATFEERQQYTGIMALVFGASGILNLVLVPSWWWLGACMLVVAGVKLNIWKNNKE